MRLAPCALYLTPYTLRYTLCPMPYAPILDSPNQVFYTLYSAAILAQNKDISI
jgi:hypothetical protein